MKTIVCYDDNPDYGGHQVMACLAVEALARAKDIKLIFFYSPQNKRLKRRLSNIQAGSGNMELRTTPFRTQKLQGLRNRLAFKSIRALRTTARSRKSRPRALHSGRNRRCLAGPVRRSQNESPLHQLHSNSAPHVANGRQTRLHPRPDQRLSVPPSQWMDHHQRIDENPPRRTRHQTSD